MKNRHILLSQEEIEMLIVALNTFRNMMEKEKVDIPGAHDYEGLENDLRMVLAGKL